MKFKASMAPEAAIDSSSFIASSYKLLRYSLGKCFLRGCLAGSLVNIGKLKLLSSLSDTCMVIGDDGNGKVSVNPAFGS